MVRLLLFVPILFGAGCAAAPWREDFDRLRDLAESRPAVRDAEAPDADLERALSQPLDLPTLVAAAVERNPELREASARTRAGLEGVRRAGALDDPMLKIGTEGVPLRHAGSLGYAQDNMVGLSQTFPFPGNLSLRSEAALRDAEELHQRFLDRERDVIVRLKRAYLDYYAATKAIEAHNDHLQLMEATEKISDAKFRAGAVSQQDVLKPQLEQVALHGDVLAMEQMRGSARAAINTLLHRPIDAPLGEPRELAPAGDALDFRALLARAMESRPDLKAAALRVKSTQAMLRLAERERDLPDFSVGVDYWQVPNGPDAYAAMFSINLPWFTGKRSAEARRLEQSLRADEAALDAARARAQLEVRDAWLRAEAARKAAALLRTELLPKTAQTVDVSRASYEKDKSSFLDLLDAERSLRDVRLKLIQAATQHESALADLERAVGADLRRKP
jgi:cobalt-zinc-cadmium efflux system outer membrane protein